MSRYAAELREVGIGVTSSWLTEPHGPNTKMVDVPEKSLQEYAQADLHDVSDADMLVFFSQDENTPSLRGGRHVEFGVAIALGMPILVVGPKENIFHHMFEIAHVPDWMSAMHFLQAYNPSKLMSEQ